MYYELYTHCMLYVKYYSFIFYKHLYYDLKEYEWNFDRNFTEPVYCLVYNGCFNSSKS